MGGFTHIIPVPKGSHADRSPISAWDDIKLSSLSNLVRWDYQFNIVYRYGEQVTAYAAVHIVDGN